MILRRRANPSVGGGQRGTSRPPSGIALRAHRGVTAWGRDHRGLALDPGSGEIRTGQSRDPVAELITQGPRFHLFDRAFRQIAEPERTERNPDQTVHRQPEMAEHVLNLAVLALSDRECEPDVAALRAIDGGLDFTIAHAVDGDAASQRIELRLRHAAVRAHAIAPQPSGRRQFERAGQAAIVREQQ